MTHIATMFLLDSYGRIVQTRYVEYHGAEWCELTSRGYITHTVATMGA